MMEKLRMRSSGVDIADAPSRGSVRAQRGAKCCGANSSPERGGEPAKLVEGQLRGGI